MHEQFLRVCSFVTYTGTRILYRNNYNLDSRNLNKINYFNYVATVNFPDNCIGYINVCKTAIL